MSSGTELATLGRLFTGVVQAIKGRGWFGTTGPTATTPGYAVTVISNRTATVLDASRALAGSPVGRHLSSTIREG